MSAGTSPFERVLKEVLRVGGLLSTVLLAAGLLLMLFSPWAAVAAFLSTAGLVILMATPVARVVASVAGYAAERDWAFFALTLSVLLALLGSLIVAILG